MSNVATRVSDVQLDFMSDLQSYGSAVDGKLSDFFGEQISSVPGELRHAKRMTEHLRDFCLRGGKRLRPYLTRCGYQLFGGRNFDLVLEASLIPELVHAFLLVHDDVMDQDDERRGGPTIHAAYRDESADGRFGDSMGILAGDLAYTLALQHLSTLPVSGDIKGRLLQVISKAVAHTVYGQELDLRGGSFDDEYLIARHKTAYYSFSMPLEMGATMAGARNDDLAKLAEYAIPCGIAFQITDDLLDGEESSAAREHASGFVEQAKIALESLTGAEEAKHRLYALADFIVRREV